MRVTQSNYGQIVSLVSGFRVTQVCASSIVPRRRLADGSGSRTARPRRFVLY